MSPLHSTPETIVDTVLAHKSFVTLLFASIFPAAGCSGCSPAQDSDRIEVLLKTLKAEDLPPLGTTWSSCHAAYQGCRGGSPLLWHCGKHWLLGPPWTWCEPNPANSDRVETTHSDRQVGRAPVSRCDRHDAVLDPPVVTYRGRATGGDR